MQSTYPVEKRIVLGNIIEHPFTQTAKLETPGNFPLVRTSDGISKNNLKFEKKGYYLTDVSYDFAKYLQWIQDRQMQHTDKLIVDPITKMTVGVSRNGQYFYLTAKQQTTINYNRDDVYSPYQDKIIGQVGSNGIYGRKPEEKGCNIF